MNVTHPEDARGAELSRGLQAIWHESLERTTHVIAQFEDAARASAAGELTEADRIDAAMAAHQLAGMASIFGRAQLSAMARDAEARLCELSADAPAPLCDEQARELGRLAAAMRSLLDD